MTVLLSAKEKEDLVLELLNKGHTQREIAKIAHVSFREIARIRRMITDAEKDYDENDKNLSNPSKAFKLFMEGKSLVQVAIELDLETNEVIATYNDYLRLQTMYKVASILKEYKNQLASFLKLFELLKRNRTRVKDIRYAMENVNNINALKSQREKLNEEVQSMIDQKDILLATINNIKKAYY